MLGKNIYEYRKKMGLSQEKLAEKIDVTRQTISNWELGETSPNPDQLKLLSKELNVSIDELLDNNIKDILIEKTNNNERIAKSTFNTLKCFIIFIVIIFIGIIILNILKNKNDEDKGILKEESIICNLYGEEHSYSIKYYELTGEPKESGGDTYFYDILDLGKYIDAHQIFNIINDYVKKNGGTCVTINDRDLTDIVDVTFKEGTLTNTGGTIVIKDSSPNKIVYGQEFWIEKYTKGNYEILKPIHDNYGFNAMAYYVDEDGKLEMNQNWEYIYGKLDKGIYRIVKDVFFDSDVPINENDHYYIWSEFEIE